MDLETQTIYFSLLVSNPDLYARCNNIINPSYFDPELRRGVTYIKNYFEQHHALPSKLLIKAETKLDVQDIQSTKHEQTEIANEIEMFCRHRAVEIAIISSPELLQKRDFNTIIENLKLAIEVSLNRDLGIDYFANVGDRLRDLLNNSPVIPTGWDDVDAEIGGGISRQELLLLAAASGVGKSIVMSNLAVNLAKRNLKVVYVSLELADRVVGKRFDSMFTGISQTEIFNRIDEVEQLVLDTKSNTNGELYIKRMPESTTTSNHIRAYLKELQQTKGFIPDILVVDYLDLMASNRNISAENIFIKDKFVAEELRAIGLEYDCAVVTASQLGRQSLESDNVGQQHIQGGFSKVQTADLMIAILQDDLMRAQGEYVFKYVKTRNSGGVGKSTILKWDPIALRVESIEHKVDKNWADQRKKSAEDAVMRELELTGNVFKNQETASLDDLLKLVKM